MVNKVLAGVEIFQVNPMFHTTYVMGNLEIIWKIPALARDVYILHIKVEIVHVDPSFLLVEGETGD